MDHEKPEKPEKQPPHEKPEKPEKQPPPEGWGRKPKKPGNPAGWVRKSGARPTIQIQPKKEPRGGR